MEPHTRYCQSADGVRVPYTILGRGPVLLYVPAWGTSNITLDLERRECRTFFDRLAQARTMVYLTRRVISARDAAPEAHLFAAQLSDIGAVLDAVDAPSCDLFAMDDGTSLAVAFAAESPARVQHLVLWAPYARTSTRMRSRR